MAKMEARGITAQIYSHPLGFQGHALGPSIDMYWPPPAAR